MKKNKWFLCPAISGILAIICFIVAWVAANTQPSRVAYDVAKAYGDTSSEDFWIKLPDSMEVAVTCFLLIAVILLIVGVVQRKLNNQVPPPYMNYNYAYVNNNPTPNLVQNLSQKVKTNAIIWIIVASLQAIIGFFLFAEGILLNSQYVYFEPGTDYIIYGPFMLIVSVLNYFGAAQNFKYSKEVLIKPVGIVAKFSPIGG